MGKAAGRPLNIAIGVHGRFHAFDVAKALHQLGQEVTLFMNYPAFVARRFNLEGVRLQSFALHGGVTRGLGRLAGGKLLGRFEPTLHQWFGKWLAHQLQGATFDVVNLYSGIAEETLRLRDSDRIQSVCLLERASTHIRVQSRILAEEATRTTTHIDAPSPWMISRETREYQWAEHINVLSSFSKRTFMEEGIPSNRVSVTPLGVNTSQFRASLEIIHARQKSILQGNPLRLLYVGQVGFRKGLWDIGNIAKAIEPSQFEMTLVGTVLPEAKAFVETLPSWVKVVGHQPQTTLPEWYANADLFLFPTIEDGFPTVLGQAQAAGLPIIATTNCSAPDFLEEGKSGWVVPIRAPHQIVEQLRWCDANRPALADMVAYTHQHPFIRDWLDVGRDYLTLMQRLVAER
jgi:glycosyltransferase involved in cell wall biosynthesis